MAFIIFLLVIVANQLISVSDSHPVPTGIALDLVHRDHILSPQLSRTERIRRMLQRDMRRVVSSRKQQNTAMATGVTTVEAGAIYGITQYVVKLKVGTPPQEVLMIPDTASDLNMLKCNYKGKKISAGPVFEAGKSSSFKGISCASDMCVTLASMARQDKTLCNGYCAYSNYSYWSGLSTRGVFANESYTFTLTNGKEVVLDNMLIGCSTSAGGLGPNIKRAHGILGLTSLNSPLSFPALSSPLFGMKFSMCLPDHLNNLSTASGKFILGEPEGFLPDNMSYTTLDTDTLRIIPFYGLSITGVYVNGIEVDIPSAVWDNSIEDGGIIVDVGSSLTLLAESAYGKITKALHGSLSGFMKRVTDEENVFEYCYLSEGYDESRVPKLEIEFSGRARFKPDPKNYLIEINSELKCLGFQLLNSDWTGPSIIGNVMMQEHFLEFDLENNIFGFGKSSCTSKKT